MSRNVEELKKIAARVTTANGDVSAVPGNTIEEVLEYIVKNFNVDASGYLIVSNLLINLLKRNIAIQPVDEGANLGATGSFISNDLLGLEANATYLLKGYYVNASGERVDISEQKASSDDGGTVTIYFDNGITFNEDIVGDGRELNITTSGIEAVEVVLEGLYKIA